MYRIYICYQFRTTYQRNSARLVDGIGEEVGYGFPSRIALRAAPRAFCVTALASALGSPKESIFSAPEPKAQVHYCDHALSVRPSSVRPSLTFHIFDFSSETTERNLTKLYRKVDLNVLYQVCVFRADRKNKMAALASDWLRHFPLLL